MRKSIIPVLLSSLILTLTACASKPDEASADSDSISRSSEARKQLEAELFSESAVAENTDEHSSETLAGESTDENSASDAALQSCTVDNVTFSVDASLISQSGMEGTFLAPDQTYAYQLQAITPLGDSMPQEFFDALIETYENKYNVISYDSTLSAYTSPDGVECWRSNIKMTVNTTFFDIDVLIAPQKNKVVSFAATCSSAEPELVDIRTVSSTATFQIGAADYVSGNSFIGSDGSELCLYADGTFANYEHTDDYDGDCLTGTYEVYYGQPAIDQVVQMTEYGLTADEMDGALLAAQDGYVLTSERRTLLLQDDIDSPDTYHVCLDTFYAIILHNEQYISPDQASMTVDTTMLFIAYYIPELQLLDMTNANTASYAQFIYKEPAGEPH